jgi:hypothetical protein
MVPGSDSGDHLLLYEVSNILFIIFAIQFFTQKAFTRTSALLQNLNAFRREAELHLIFF